MNRYLLASIFITTLLTVSCVSTPPSEKVKVGIILPLSGAQAYLGADSEKGIALAAQDARNIAFITEDSRSDSKTAINAFTKLTNVDGVHVIIGFTSADTLAVAPLANEKKIVVITTLGSAAKITSAGDYVFRVRETGALHGKIMAEYAITKGWKRAAVLSVNAENGLSYADAFEKRYEELGGHIVAHELYEKDAREVMTQATKIKDAQPEIVYLPGFADGIGRAANTLRTTGVKAQFLSSTGAEDPIFIETAAGAAEGTILTSPFDPDAAQAATFQRRYESAYGARTQTFYSTNAYDAALLVSEIVSYCADDADCIKDALYSTQNYTGVSGTFSFDRNGDVERVIYFKTVQNNSFVVTK